MQIYRTYLRLSSLFWLRGCLDIKAWISVDFEDPWYPLGVQHHVNSKDMKAFSWLVFRIRAFHEIPKIRLDGFEEMLHQLDYFSFYSFTISSFFFQTFSVTSQSSLWSSVLLCQFFCVHEPITIFIYAVISEMLIQIRLLFDTFFGAFVIFSAESREPFFIQECNKWIHTSNQNVEPKVMLLFPEQKRVIDVPLNNWVGLQQVAFVSSRVNLSEAIRCW